MIPRYDGLVPAIRRPTPSAGVGSAPHSSPSPAKRQPTTITRYTIRPSLDPTAASPDNATASTATTAVASERERRLYTFLPSADVTTPPRELRVAAYFFGDTDATPAHAFDNGEPDGDNDGSGDSEGEADFSSPLATATAARAASMAPAENRNGSGTQGRRRRRRRGKEPMRLEYQGLVDKSTPASSSPSVGPAATAATATEASRQVAKMASTPAAEYSHLSCVLLELPASWNTAIEDSVDGSSSNSSNAAPRDFSSGATTLIPLTALSRPVLQLWAEERGGFSVDNVPASWASSRLTRISKSDWKTMDDADAEMHRPRNWSDDDGGGGDSDGDVAAKTATSTLSARERKRSKTEANTEAIRTFIGSAKAALRGNAIGDEGENEGERSTVSGEAQPAREITALPKAASPPPPATVKIDAVVAPAKAAALAETSVPPRTLSLRVTPAPVRTPAEVPSSVSASQPSKSVDNNPSLVAKESDGPTAPTLSSLGAAVVNDIQRTEARTAAPLAELQKRILKKLPEFAVMSQKMKSPATKKEAVEWFQTSQRELRVWLQGQGHNIASDGTVTFGG